MILLDGRAYSRSFLSRRRSPRLTKLDKKAQMPFYIPLLRKTAIKMGEPHLPQPSSLIYPSAPASFIQETSPHLLKKTRNKPSFTQEKSIDTLRPRVVYFPYRETAQQNARQRGGGGVGNGVDAKQIPENALKESSNRQDARRESRVGVTGWRIDGELVPEQTERKPDRPGGREAASRKTAA